MINAFYSDEVIAGVTWWTDTGSVVAKLTACCCQLHQNHLCTVHHAASIYPDLPSTHSCPSRQCDAHSALQETVKSSSSYPSCWFFTENMQLRKAKTDSYRQCFSTRRLRAIFSPTSVHTGLVRTILARSALTALTRPPVDSEPMFTISTSFLDSFWTCRRTQT